MMEIFFPVMAVLLLAPLNLDGPVLTLDNLASLFVEMDFWEERKNATMVILPRVMDVTKDVSWTLPSDVPLLVNFASEGVVTEFCNKEKCAMTETEFPETDVRTAEGPLAGLVQPQESLALLTAEMP